MAKLTVTEQLKIANDALAVARFDLSTIHANYTEAINSAKLARIEDHAAVKSEFDSKIARLEKELASSISSQSYYSKQDSEKTEELEQIHALLDVLPGAVGRKIVGNNGYDRDVKLMTRFASYLAARSTGTVGPMN